MVLPDNALSKAIDDPSAVFSYLKTRTYLRIEPVFTSLEGYITRPFAFNLFDEEWNVAVILDALRFDIGADSDLVRLLGEPKRVYSAGAHSETWIRRTFARATTEQRQATSYVSANAHADRVLPDDIGYIDPVWKDGYDPDLGTFPPRIVTNRAIETARRRDPDYLVVHYMQPHLPPVRESSVEFKLDTSGDHWVPGNPWKRTKTGELDGEEVADAYRRNVGVLVDELKLLLENVGGDRILVTADHGNMLGEWGQWGHYFKWNMHPAVRHVPLFERTGSDTGNHEPRQLAIQDDTQIEEKLAALGYK